MVYSEERIHIDSRYISNIFGKFDEHIKIIERGLKVKIVLRGDEVIISGEEDAVNSAKHVFEELSLLAKRGNDITVQNVTYAMTLDKEKSQHSISEMEDYVICHTVNGKPIKPKTIGQQQYVDAIEKKMITFGTGPAGTGKTYLAMAEAIRAFKAEEIHRIILTRPAIEAGEKLGFLPGDLQSKVDPYLRPLYDALYQIMGAENFMKNMEKGQIEVAPLAYMRGRTLDNSFIILDEAQNTTPAQMKMFLTRIGFGSKVVVTGDRTQKDLASTEKSGLDEAVKILDGIDEIAFINLTSRDVVRHPLVLKIVDAYEKYEAKQSGAGKNQKEKNK